MPYPFSDDAQRLFAYRKEPGGDGLPSLGRDVPPVLENMTLREIDMLELERRQGAVARAGQDCERDQGAVAQFDVGRGWHRFEDVDDLLQGRHRRRAARLRDPRIIGRQVEIVGVGIGQF